MADFSRSLGLGVTLDLKDRLTSKIVKTNAAMKSTDATALRLTKNVRSLGIALGAGAVAAVGGGALLSVLGDTVKVGADYESVLFDVQRTTGFADAEIKELGKDLIELTAPLPLSAANLGRVAVIAGQLGVSATEGAEGVKQLAFTSTRLATATKELTEEQAAIGLAGLAKIFAVDISKSGENLASTLVRMGKTSSATAPELINITTRLGPMAAAMGFSAAETVGFSAALRDARLPAQAAARGISIALKNMATRSGDFAKALGVQEDQFKAALGKNPVQVLTGFVSALGKLEGVQAAQVLKKLGLNADITIKSLLSLSRNSEGLKARLDDARNAFSENVELQKTFETQMKGLSPAVKTAAGNIENIAISMSNALLPALTKVVKGINSFLSFIVRLPQPVITLGTVILFAVGTTLLLGGSLVVLIAILGFLNIGLSKTRIGMVLMNRSQKAGVASAARLGLAWTLLRIKQAALSVATLAYNGVLAILSLTMGKKAVTAAIRFGAALAANPVGAVIAGIVILVGLMFFLAKRFDIVRAAIGFFMGWVRLAFQGLQALFTLIGGVIAGIASEISVSFDPAILQDFSKFLDWIKFGLIAFTEILAEMAPNMKDAFMVGITVGQVLGQVIMGIFNSVRGIFNFVMKIIAGFQKISEVGGGFLSKVPGLSVIPGLPIPGLAEGGIVTKPTVAAIAEERPEAVLPLDPNVLERFVAPKEDKPAQANRIMVTIPVELDGRVIAKAMREIEVEEGVRGFMAPIRLVRGAV